MQMEQLRPMISQANNKKLKGFTLIEVLIALAIVAIALAAVIKATSSDVKNTDRIKSVTIGHWVQMHAVAMLQLKLLNPSSSQTISQVTTMLNQKWYWRAQISNTPSNTIKKATITISQSRQGPFLQPLVAYIMVDQ